MTSQQLGIAQTARVCLSTANPGWTVTVCAACGRHLGWLFRAAGGSGAFHALILDRLVETGGEDEG